MDRPQRTPVAAETGVYCASKHALLGLSRSLYQEYRERGVRAYSVSPGSIQTPMGATDTRQDYSTFLNPQEVAEYISFIMAYDNEMISEEIRLNRVTDTDEDFRAPIFARPERWRLSLARPEGTAKLLLSGLNEAGADVILVDIIEELAGDRV